MTLAMYFDPFRDFHRLAAGLLDSAQGPRFMPIDLYREGDHYILNADLPGVDPGSVDLDVDGQLLTIRAERTARGDHNGKWLAHERPNGSFLRQLNLGDGIATENISANYSNGVLSVMIPVSERAKPRKVAITANGGSTSVRPEVSSASAGTAADASGARESGHGS
jgi:HSP20 family protein